MPRSRSLTVLLPLVAASIVPAADSSLQFHGFASQGYLYTLNNNFYGRTTGGGTAEFNEFGLNATARPVDRLRVGLQLFAGDQGKYGNDKLQLDWAYGNYELPSPCPEVDVNVSAGRFKTGHGLYNDYRDLDMTRTSVFLPSTVYPSTFRDLYIAANGAQINSTVRAGALGSFDLSAFGGTQNVDNAAGTPVADLFSQGYFTITNINVKRITGGSLTWNTPVDGLRFKGSILNASDITATGTVEEGVAIPVPGPVHPAITFPTKNAVNYNMPLWRSVIISSEYQHENLTLAAEGLYETYTVDTEFDRSVAGVLQTTHDTSHVVYRGAYAAASYRFLPKWEGSLSGNYMTLEDGTTLSNADDNLERHTQRGGTVALRFDPVDHWVIKAEFQRNRGTLGVSKADNPDGLELYWNLFALKTTFDF